MGQIRPCGPEISVVSSSRHYTGAIYDVISSFPPWENSRRDPLLDFTERERVVEGERGCIQSRGGKGAESKREGKRRSD